VLARAKAADDEVAARRGSEYAGDEDPYKKPREESEDDSDDWDEA
jgi:ribosome-binding factor A